ncbi:hypothetical protein [Catellatospora sichuanensis]|uniref:NACHT N-terminal Helical domain 1-containing protein n=1 Tax=Catellatospora sichuanensis TaxID=1969805 RepID=UPI0011820BA8|nr:hypothetical protein [Catellatospora sichuanensis]
MPGDIRGLSQKIVENALKVAFPSAGDRIEGISGLVSSIREIKANRKARSGVAARLEEAAFEIEERLLVYAQREFRNLPKAERDLAVAGVLAAIDSMDTIEDLAVSDVHSARLFQLLVPRAEEHWHHESLSEPALGYGRTYLAHACSYVAAVVQALPEFDARVNMETYQIVRRLEEELREAISRVVTPTVGLSGAQLTAGDEASHRTDITLEYGTIELFGLSLPDKLRKQPIHSA